MHEQKNLHSQKNSEFFLEQQNFSQNLRKLFHSLVVSKKGVRDWLKTISPQPTQPTLILSATLYFLAICSTLKRQENVNWLSLLLEAKMPGLTKPCQESSWESFENITSEYINCGIHRSTIEADISKSRTLIKLPSPWNKQIRKAFLGFFLENSNSSAPLLNDTLNCYEKNVSSVDSQRGILSWYRIDACRPGSKSILSVRKNSFQRNQMTSYQTDKENTISYRVSPLSLKKRNGNQTTNLSEKIVALSYFFPFQGNRERIYAENDSIPSKLDSAYNNDITNSSLFSSFEKKESEKNLKNAKKDFFEQHVLIQENELLGDTQNALKDSKEEILSNKPSRHFFPLQQNFKKKRKKFLGTEWTYFEDTLKHIFYFYGLIPPSHLTSLDDFLLSGKEAEKSIPSSFYESNERNADGRHIFLEENDTLFLLEEVATQSKNLNAFSKYHQIVHTNFFSNDLVRNRFMSGYKFPELTQKQTSSFYTQFVFPRLVFSSWCSFSQAELLNFVIQSPLKIQLPPVLPSFFYQQKIQQIDPFFQKETNSLHRYQENFLSYFLNKEKKNANQERLPQWESQNFTIQYRTICLEELKEVTRIFSKLGKNYKEYLSQPKDSPSAIAISPSLEDDQLLEAKKEILGHVDVESETKNEKSKPTQLERLQKIRERDHALEEAKKLRSLAYHNKLALSPKTTNYDLLKPKEFDSDFWITAKLGSQNMRSDRKYSFFGRMSILPKKLVAKEQEDITKQILEGTAENLVASTSQAQRERENKPLIDLQARARRDRIQLLAEPDLEAHHFLGRNYRTQRTNPRLRGKRLSFPHQAFFWQKKKMRSSLLGSPSKRYVVMPTISQSDWQKILEWQLKNYFFEEDKRLEAERKQDPEKTFKIKRINIYLPWVTLHTALDKPFEWPLTRMDLREDDALSLVPALFSSPKIKVNSKTAPKSCPSTPFLTKVTLPSPTDAVDYWMTGRQFTLSSKNEVSSHKKSNFSSFSNSKAGKKQGKKDLSAKKVVTKQFLFEPLTHHSWLLIYQLVLAFFLRGVFKYIYRVQLRNFIIAICSSQLGVAITSPELREWIHHGPPQLFYTPQKNLQDVAGSEETIPVVSEVIWFLRNSGRSRMKMRGVLLAGPSSTEKISLVQAIAGEAQVPVIVQSMNALTLSSDQPYEKLENAFALARKKAPCVLFLDELDGIGKSRHSVVRNDIGAADSLFSLDIERGETKLQLTKLSEKLQISSFSPSHSYLNSRWEAAGSSFSTRIEKELQDLHSSQAGSGIGRKSQFGASTAQSDSEGRRINLLLRLLTELDGVRPLNGVVVIATSQRPARLDPALLRPGRFDRIVNVQQPNKTRRIQLFQNEIQKRDGQGKEYMPWDYFGIRTAHLSGSQILSAINQSAIRAILNDTMHTIETLEHGINCVTGEKNKTREIKFVTKNDPFHISRLAFYQAGKAVVQSLLLDHPQVAFLSLTESLDQGKTTTSESEVGKLEQNALQGGLSYENSQKENPHQKESNKKVVKTNKKKVSQKWDSQKITGIEGETAEVRNQSWKKSYLIPTRHVSSARTRLDFETRLVGLYAGKAGELLHVSGRKNHSQIVSGEKKRRAMSFLWESNLGFVELLAASSLLHLTIGRWYLYSQNLVTLKTNRVIGSLNHEQLNEQNLSVFQNVSRQLEGVKQNFGEGSTRDREENLSDTLSSFISITKNQQKREKAAYWQEKICQEIEMSERPYGRWYRLYLPKVEESNRNEEWVAPDTLFHQSDTLPNLKLKKLDTKSQLKTLNDLYLVERDTLYHNMVINCFHKAFHLLGENRELFDFFADNLLRFQILRSYEITRICSFYLQEKKVLIN